MALAPRGGNDVVYTPDSLAAEIVKHFNPNGRMCEPCKGGGAFTRVMPGCDWFEIAEGRDFFGAQGRWDWVVTNPPWSKFRGFLIKSMTVADNVVFLALLNAWFMRARMRDMEQHGFGLVEALLLDTPGKPWPQTGFQLAAVHARRGYSGPMTFSKLGVGDTEKPVAWIRFCSDGSYEGPIMDARIEDVRKKSGAWTPLYARRQIDHEAANEIGRLRVIEAAACAAVDFDQWQGDAWYESMMALQKALHDSHEDACQNCDGTGDVTNQVGEYLGQCNCGAPSQFLAEMTQIDAELKVGAGDTAVQVELLPANV